MKYTFPRAKTAIALDVDARGSARRAGGTHGTACPSAILPVQPLSKWEQSKLEKQILTISTWKDGNKIIAQPPSRCRPMPPIDRKRGQIRDPTAKVMRRFKRKMAEVKRSETAYTFCLSYPDAFPLASGARKHFATLQRWLNWKHKEWGMFYKREPQGRGATHFHMVCFLGDDFYKAKEIGDDICRKWCQITTGQGEEHEKQLNVHLYFNPVELEWDKHDKRKRKNNFQEMRGDTFFNYLAKYIAKDSDKMPEGYENEGGGKWWGYVNRKSIPWAEMEQEIIGYDDPETQKKIARFLYETRQRRAQAAVDSLHLTTSNPRLAADNLFRAMMKKDEHKKLGGKAVRKLAKHIIFKMDGSRRALDAPIKANRIRRTGAITLLGNPEPLIQAIQRFLTKSLDKESRSRIFGDNYQWSQN